jgi:hypothetical protein
VLQFLLFPPQTSRSDELFTVTGAPSESTAMFLSAGMPGAAEDSSDRK